MMCWCAAAPCLYICRVCYCFCPDRLKRCGVSFSLSLSVWLGFHSCNSAKRQRCATDGRNDYYYMHAYHTTTTTPPTPPHHNIWMFGMYIPPLGGRNGPRTRSTSSMNSTTCCLCDGGDVMMMMMRVRALACRAVATRAHQHKRRLRLIRLDVCHCLPNGHHLLGRPKRMRERESPTKMCWLNIARD